MRWNKNEARKRGGIVPEPLRAIVLLAVAAVAVLVCCCCRACSEVRLIAGASWPLDILVGC